MYVATPIASISASSSRRSSHQSKKCRKIAVLMFYDIDRSTHQRNIERLESADKPDSDVRAEVNALNGEHTVVRAIS
jgi:hypothetical protein